MTAFEILLNKLYDTIEQNEPKYSQSVNKYKLGDLRKLIRKYVDTSFAHGNNLKYKSLLSKMLQQSASMLQQSNHEDWAKVRVAFLENDLHTIRRDRGKTDVANLKMNLDRAF